jgi:eukaryotic-like serine/threonine-protein kinase
MKPPRTSGTYNVLVLFCFFLAVAGCKSLQLGPTGRAEGSDWPVEGGNGAHTSSVDLDLLPPLEEVWSYNANAGFGEGSPLLLGDKIIVATRKGEIHAIDMHSGKRVGVKGFGTTIEGAPAIGHDMIYVPVAWGGQAVYAHDFGSGKVAWVHNGPPVEAGLLLQTGVLIAVDFASRVRGMDAQTGSVRWELVLDSAAVYASSPVALSDTAAAAGNDRGIVTAFNSHTGQVLWEADVSAPVQRTAAAWQDRLYVPTTRGRLIALDTQSGLPVWTFSLPDSSVYIASPAVDGDRVVFGASDGYVRSVDAATGALEWSVDLREAVTVAPLLLRNAVYAGALNGWLYALDPATGAVSWQVDLEGRIGSSMAVREGQLVVLSEPGTVRLFRPVKGESAQRP